MEIKVIDQSTLEIKGNIKSIEDYNEIKKVAQGLISKGADTLTFNIVESFSMVSSVIGFLIKLINIDHVKVHVIVYDDRLYSLLDQLNLVRLFNVEKK